MEFRERVSGLVVGRYALMARDYLSHHEPMVLANLRTKGLLGEYLEEVQRKTALTIEDWVQNYKALNPLTQRSYLEQVRQESMARRLAEESLLPGLFLQEAEMVL